MPSCNTFINVGLMFRSQNLFPTYSLVRRFVSTLDLREVSRVQTDALLHEKCLLVDEDDRIVGSASKLRCHQIDSITKLCPLHRAFSVFLFNANGELLLQQRSSRKVTFPLYYTNTCCSHPLDTPDEREGVDGIIAASRRRLHFELGIPLNEIEPSDFSYLTRILYNGQVEGSPFGEHEIDYILFVRKDVTLKPNPEEVKECRFVSRTNITSSLAELQRNGILLTPWFRLVLKHFLLCWWDNLENLQHYQDHNKIYRFN